MKTKTQSTPKFFEIRRVDLWGDYGTTLVNGDLFSIERENGRLTIQRTGPFVPPVSIRGSMIVTPAFRQQLKGEFPYLRFKEVIVKKVVELHWENWDRNKDPEIYPPEGDPANYLFELPHSPEAAAQIGPLYEIIMRNGAKGRIIPTERVYDSGTIVEVDSWNGDDFFRTTINKVERKLVTDKAKAWFEKVAGEWVSFRPLLTE